MALPSTGGSVLSKNTGPYITLDLFGIDKDCKTVTATWAPDNRPWRAWWQINGGIV